MSDTTSAAPSPDAAAASAPLPASLPGRIQAMLFNPRQTWPALVAENAGIGRIYREHLVWLLLLAAVAGFIGNSVIGHGAFGITVRVPIVAGLVQMVLGFVLSLPMFYVAALVASALAPRFQGQASVTAGMRLVAYAATAGLVGSVFSAIPMLGFLALIAGMYSIWLLYLGAPVVMQVPASRAVGYTAVLVICMVVLGAIVGMVVSVVTPGRGDVQMRVGDTSVRVPADGAGGLTAAILGKAQQAIEHGDGDTAKTPQTPVAELQDAARRAEEALEKRDMVASTQAMVEMVTSAQRAANEAAKAAEKAGQATRQPLSTDALRAHVPGELIGLARTRINTRTEAAMGMSITSLTARYENEQAQLRLALQDVSGTPLMAMAHAMAAGASFTRETDGLIERLHHENGVTYHETYRADGSHASLRVFLPNQLVLEMEGELGMHQLRGAAQEMDLPRLARLGVHP